MKNTPRDHELEAGYCRRELSINFTLSGDHSFSVSLDDSYGRLDLMRLCQDAGNAAINVLRMVSPTIPKEECDSPYLQVRLRYFELEDGDGMLGTTIETQCGDLLTKDNQDSIVRDVLGKAIPHFEQSIDLLQITLL